MDMILKAWKNNQMASPPTELIFLDFAERIKSNSMGKFHIPQIWDGSLAEKQCEVFASRREGRVVKRDRSLVSDAEIHPFDLAILKQLEAEASVASSTNNTGSSTKASKATKGE